MTQREMRKTRTTRTTMRRGQRWGGDNKEGTMGENNDDGG